MPTSSMYANLPRICGISSRLLVQWAVSGFLAFGILVALIAHLLRGDFRYSGWSLAGLIVLTAGLCSGVWWLWFRFVVVRLSEYSCRTKIIWHAVALLFGGWLVVAIPVAPPCSWADGVGIGFFVLLGSVWMATRPALASNPNVSRWAWLGYALPPGLYWTYYLWVFWPALISPDSVILWNQIDWNCYGDNHPACYTMVNGLITRLWHSPAPVAMVQIILLSLVIGLGLFWMRRHGMPRWLAIMASCLLAFAPANGLLVIAIWKDIFYCTALLALVVVMLAIVQTEGRWLGHRLAWLWLAIPAIAVWLFRHNGFPVVIAVFMALPLFYRRQWRPILLSLLVCAASVAMVKGPVYWAAGVQPVDGWLKAAPFLHYIAAHVAAKTPLQLEEQAVLDRIIPPGEGRAWPYNPVSVDPIYAAKGMNLKAIAENLPELKRIFFSLTYRRPRVTLEHVKNCSRIVWQVQKSPVNVAPMGFENHRAMRFDPAMLGFDAYKVKYEYSPVDRPSPPCIESSLSADWQWLAWRPAFFMYLFFAGCIVAGIRGRTWKYALVALPLFVQEAVMAALGLSPDFRYHWGVYLAGILMSGYLLFAIPRREVKVVASGEEISESDIHSMDARCSI